MPGTLVAAHYYNKDVKSQIQSLIDSGEKAFTVSNDNLGGDPAHGIYKYLTLQYEDDGVVITRTAGEGQEIYIGLRTIPRSPGKLADAFYDHKDVKSIIESRIRSGDEFFTVSNDNLGGDPRPTVYKYLVLQYESENGVRVTRSAGEGQSIWIAN